MKQAVLVAISMLLLSGSCRIINGQDFELRGSLREWVLVFTHEPNEVDFTESRCKLELLSSFSDRTAFHVRSYLTHDGRSREVEWDLKQAYIDFYSDWFTVRFGRQLMTWGKADEMNPTDILNPQDMSIILEEKIIRKIGLFAVKTNWFFCDMELETIWKPEFESMRIPEPGSRWGFFSIPGVTEIPAPDYPDDDLDKTEWGLKLSRTVSQFDLAVTWFDGWDNIFTPEFTRDPQTQQDELTRLSFHRTKMFGGAFAGSISTVGIWGEGAYFLTEDHAGVKRNIKNPYFQYVIGSDYTFFDGLRINIQYLQEVATKIDDSEERGLEDDMISRLGLAIPLRQALTGRVELRFGSGAAHAVEIFGIYDLDNDGYLMGPKLTLSPEDAVNIEIGASIFNGSGNSLFGRFTYNDCMYVRCTYSF